MMAGIAFATVNALMEELIWRRHTVRGRISVPAWPHCNITAGGVFRSRAHPRNPAGHYRHTARGCLGYRRRVPSPAYERTASTCAQPHRRRCNSILLDCFRCPIELRGRCSERSLATARDSISNFLKSSHDKTPVVYREVRFGSRAAFPNALPPCPDSCRRAAPRKSVESGQKPAMRFERLISADRCKAVRPDNPSKPACRGTNA
jgi:hypothetical protein